MSRDLVVAVDAEADVERMFKALTTQQGLAGFWTPDVTAAPEVGATLRFGFEEAPADLVFTVEDLEPGKRVQWGCQGPWPYWEGTTVEWRLDGSPAGATRVILRHGGWADDYPDGDLGSVTYTWALVLGALKRYAETRTPQPALR